MKPNNRKFLDDSPSSASSAVAAAAAPSSRSSIAYYNYPRPFLSPTTNEDNDTLTSTLSPMKPLRPPMSVFDSSMALTVVVLLTVLFFMGFFSVYIHRLSDDSSPNDHRRRRYQSRRDSSSGIDPSTIQSLPLFAYDGNARAKEPVDCPICLSEFQQKETVKVIPFCGHVFHPQCIDMWLSNRCSCPLCRSTQLLPPLPPPLPPDRNDDDPSSSSWFVAMEEGFVRPSSGGYLTVLPRSTDIQSSGPTDIEIGCAERRRRRGQQQELDVPIPSCSGASVTRANSFSSGSSSRLGEDKDRVYSFSLPRSSSF
ncbi:hypothetical protein NE237_003370 [Protea cynaroides]|uniref:RING-type E3 ubiquitin transferase n=1 Tax=Protea cynaroides TaxID=273540 RepID=A0A9Q0KGX9_9MAGN|nr:hypothetical protein NE237_003370 [Protea cynaroides]